MSTELSILELLDKKETPKPVMSEMLEKLTSLPKIQHNSNFKL